MAIVNYFNCPSFEVSSWKSIGDQTWTQNSGGTLQRVTSGTATSGTYSLSHSFSNTISGQTYAAGFYVDITIPDTAVNKTWTFSFDKRDTVSASRSYTAKVAATSSPATTIASTFVSAGRNSVTFTQTPGLTRVRLDVSATVPYPNSASGYFDSFRLCEGTSTTYIDGNTAGYVWAGTPHASQTLDAPSVTYGGIWNYWTQPKTNTVPWTAYWESGSQTSDGMAITNGPGGITVSGAISRSSSSTFKDIGLDSGNAGNWAVPLDGLPAGTAYLSLTCTSITGASVNDVIKTRLVFWNASRAYISESLGSLPIAGGRSGGAVNVPAGAAYASLYITISTPSGFTSSAHTVTASFNDIRLSTQNEVNYLDGDAAGYGWKGAANNSPTIASVPAQSTASSTSSGSLEMRTYSLAQATAFGASTGSVDVWLLGAEMVAEGSSTGSVALWPYGPASLSGDGTSSGSLRGDTIVYFELSGTADSIGGLGADIAYLTFADGAGSSVGSLLMVRPDELNPAGPLVATGISIGSIEMAIAGVTSASGEGISIGLLDVGAYIPAGAFADFAVFGIGETDPLKSVTAKSNGGVLTGASGAEWTRVYGEFTVPADQPTSDGTLWRRAAYVVPGIKFDSVPAGAWQEFTQYQVELAGPSGPVAFQPGASLRPLVYADRINLSPHTIGVVAEPGPWYTADDIDSPIPGDPTGALRVTVKFGQNLLIGTNLDWLRPNTRYTVSLYLATYGNIADLGINVVEPDTLESLSSQAFWSQQMDDEQMDGWRRIHVSFVAPEDGRALLVFNPFIWAQTADEVFDVAGLLVEEGAEVLPYFWPDGTSQDTAYRSGYSDATGGVFYYRERERRTYILKKALTDHVPTGIGIGEPEFGTIPHIDL